MNPTKAEFIELFHRSGWNQTDCARRLEITKAAVNKYVTGDAVPPAGTVKLLRMIVALEVDGAPSVLRETPLPYRVTPEAQALASEINELDEGTQKLLVPAIQKLLSGYRKEPRKRARNSHKST